MRKDVRNLLITGMVACFVGIIMGVGLVSPSIQPTIAYEHRDTYDYNELLICQEQVDIRQNQFDQCIEQAKEAQGLALRAIQNFEKQSVILDQCMEALDGSVGNYESL